MRYTQQIGREKMAMKVGLTFACLNMKKLAKILCKARPDTPKKSAFFIILKGKIEKMKMKPRKTPDDHTICPGFVYGLRLSQIGDSLFFSKKKKNQYIPPILSVLTYITQRPIT